MRMHYGVPHNIQSRIENQGALSPGFCDLNNDTNVIITKFLLSDICCLGSLVGIFCLGTSFGIFRLETFVCDPSCGNFRLETLF